MNEYEDVMKDICDINIKIKELEALKQKKLAILKRSFLDSGKYGQFRFTYSDYYVHTVDIDKLKKAGIYSKYLKKSRRAYCSVSKI